MAATSREPGGNQPGDTVKFGDMRALVVTLASDDGSLPLGQASTGSSSATLPAGATPLSASATGAAGAISATLAPGAVTKRSYATGFEITGGGATAASLVAATLVGILGGTATFTIAVPAGATLGIVPLSVQFASPVPASAVNTNIVLNLPSFGAGNTATNITLHGFTL